MQQSILRYVKSLQDMLSIDTGGGLALGLGLAHGFGSAPETGPALGTYLRLNEAGFLELLSSSFLQKCTKKELNILMRQYFSHHYHNFFITG